MYQGELVNFSQVSDSQFNFLTEAVKTNRNSLGKVNSSLYQYPQQKNLASARSDSDVWKWIGEQIQGTAGSNEHYSWGANPNALNPRVNKNSNLIQALDDKVRQLISTGTGGGMTRQQVVDIVEDYHGDDVALLYSNHKEQEGRITDAFNDRRMIDAKANATQAEHADFHNKLQSLGDSLKGKAGINHTHPGGPSEDCGWFGEKCWFKNLLPTVPSTAILAGVGVVAYILLKGKIK